MSRFNWAGLLEAARAIGLRPREFWALTPADLAFLLGRQSGGAPLSRARLDELAAAFPDLEGVRDNGQDREF